MNKHEKRFLSRRVCFLCEQKLDRVGCGSPFVNMRCSPEVMETRRQNCLKTYRPRMTRRKASQGSD